MRFQVPVRLRTQGAFNGAPSSPPRQESPPPGGIGLVALLSKKGHYDSDDGAFAAAQRFVPFERSSYLSADEEVEEIGSDDDQSAPPAGLSLLHAAQRSERLQLQ
jgi:hypothetical protein